MAEITFSLQRNCHLRLQKSSETPCTPKNEYWCNDSSSTDDSALASTYNLSSGSIPDNIAIRHGSLRHVDYLSHDWQGDDVWSTRRYITSNVRLQKGLSRLENALWRAWAKLNYKLKTIPPEDINWSKDSDNNWLYGPLQSSSKPSLSEIVSEPTATVSQPTGFLSQKSILKKRSMPELIRQRLMSALPVLKRAGGVQIQHGGIISINRTRDRPMFDRAVTESVTYTIRSKSDSREATDPFSPSRTSGLQPLDQGERKLLRFDEKVEQFRAIGYEDAERDWSAHSDDDSSEEGLLVKFPLKERTFVQHCTGNNSSADRKIIEKLPPTMLKYRSSPPEKTSSRSHSSTNSSINREGNTKMFSVRSSKFLEAFDDSVTIYEGRGIKYREKRLPEIAADMSMPFEDGQDATIAAPPINILINTLHKGKDIVYAIWNDGWPQLLDHLLIQSQSILLALLGATNRCS